MPSNTVMYKTTNIYSSVNLTIGRCRLAKCSVISSSLICEENIYTSLPFTLHYTNVQILPATYAIDVHSAAGLRSEGRSQPPFNYKVAVLYSNQHIKHRMYSFWASTGNTSTYET